MPIKHLRIDMSHWSRVRGKAKSGRTHKLSIVQAGLLIFLFFWRWVILKSLKSHMGLLLLSLLSVHLLISVCCYFYSFHPLLLPLFRHPTPVSLLWLLPDAQVVVNYSITPFGITKAFFSLSTGSVLLRLCWMLETRWMGKTKGGGNIVTHGKGVNKDQ